MTQTALTISADFDSGNIVMLDASDPKAVQLAIRPDTKSAHFQWFHFKVEGLHIGEPHGFSLTNAGESSYNGAWTGYNAVASYDQRTWFRVPSQFDGKALNFELTPSESQVWFAYFEPYSRERHDWLVDEALNKAGTELLADGPPQRRVLGGGLPGGGAPTGDVVDQQGAHHREGVVDAVVQPGRGRAGARCGRARARRRSGCDQARGARRVRTAAGTAHARPPRDSTKMLSILSISSGTTGTAATRRRVRLSVHSAA